MLTLMFSNISIRENILADQKYKYVFSVEEVNKLASAGMPFRDAYKKIGMDIEAGNFSYDTHLAHTHEGSIGNLHNAEVAAMMERLVAAFNFSYTNQALERLLQ